MHYLDLKMSRKSKDNQKSVLQQGHVPDNQSQISFSSVSSVSASKAYTMLWTAFNP